MAKEITTTEMLKAGVHFGHRKSKKNPKMDPYIFTIRNGVQIIDLEQTVQKLTEALEFIKKVVFEGQKVLLVGTKRQAKDPIREAAEKCEMPYVNDRWLGGTFTNFAIIHKQIEKLSELEEKIKSAEIKKYTKKEQHEFKKEIGRLNKMIGGIKIMDELPGAIFVIDISKDNLAIKEAKKKSIPIIALADTNTDPTLADYPIPCNDDAAEVIKLMTRAVAEAIIEAKKHVKKGTKKGTKS